MAYVVKGSRQVSDPSLDRDGSPSPGPIYRQAQHLISQKDEQENHPNRRDQQTEAKEQGRVQQVSQHTCQMAEGRALRKGEC